MCFGLHQLKVWRVKHFKSSWLVISALIKLRQLQATSNLYKTGWLTSVWLSIKVQSQVGCLKTLIPKPTKGTNQSMMTLTQVKQQMVLFQEATICPWPQQLERVTTRVSKHKVILLTFITNISPLLHWVVFPNMATKATKCTLVNLACPGQHLWWRVILGWWISWKMLSQRWTTVSPMCSSLMHKHIVKCWHCKTRSRSNRIRCNRDLRLPKTWV